MNCPHCASKILAGQEACSVCGFTAAAIRAYLGSDWVKLERITDNSQRLSLRDTRHLEVVLDDFERRFPQCFIASYLGALPDTLTLPDLGFWLINHGAFQTRQISRRNDFGILLIVDPLRQDACFTVGYALESVLTDAVLMSILKKLSRPLAKGNVASAIEKAVTQIEAVLKKAARKERRHDEHPPAMVADATDLGLHTLRPPSRPLLHANRPD